MMRIKIISTLVVVLGFSGLMTMGVSAFTVTNPNQSGSICSGSASSSTYCKDTAGASNTVSGPHGLIHSAIDIVSYIAGIASVIVIMVGAFRYVVSGGDSQQVSGARNMILYAVVGLIVIGAAQMAMALIIGRL